MKNLSKLLFLLISYYSFNSFAAIDCRLWQRGFPDRGNERTEFSCTKILTTNIKVDFYVSDLLTASTTSDQLKNDSKEALVKSYEAYARLGEMPQIKAVLYHKPFFDDTSELITYASAITEFARRGEACPVIIYPAGMEMDRSYFKQLIAHELFHCFQWKNYKAKVDLGTSQGIGLWWLEGTTQFMSNYVYPRANMEYSSMFDSYLPLTPLNEQSGYGNVHFFQSFFNQNDEDPSSLVRFMGLMPANASGSQVGALGGISNISDIFHEFAKSMSIPNLRDSSGNQAPLSSVGPADIVAVENLGGVFEKEFSIQPYTVHNVILPLPKGYKYKISLSGDDNMKYSIRHYDEEEWHDFPIERTMGCEFDESYEIVFSATGDNLNLATANLKIESVEAESCPCKNTTVDQCMVGNWELDPNSMRNFVMAVIGDQATVTSVEGHENMSFDSTGLAKVDMNWTGVGNGDMAGTPTEVSLSLKGNYDVQIFKKESNLLCSNMVRRDVVGNMRVTANGYTFNLPLNAGTPHDGTERQTYTCNQRELVISTTIPPGPNGSGTDNPIEIVWRYLRQ